MEVFHVSPFANGHGEEAVRVWEEPRPSPSVIGVPEGQLVVVGRIAIGVLS